jgi:hypothetical protein
MIDEVINKYGYCGFEIKTATTDGKYYFCTIEPEIKDIIIHFHNQSHSAEKEIEEKIDKYLEENNNKICQ